MHSTTKNKFKDNKNKNKQKMKPNQQQQQKIQTKGNEKTTPIFSIFQRFLKRITNFHERTENPEKTLWESFQLLSFFH